MRAGLPFVAAENYTMGYGPGALAIMASRTVQTHATFFLSRLAPGMRVLDVGCGPGTVTIGLAQATDPGEVIGVELSLAQTQKIAREARERGLNLRFEIADVYNLPFADASFDAVFMSALIGNLRHPLAALAEVHRVLKVGGFVGVKEFDHGANIFHPLSEVQARVNALHNRLRIHNGHDPDSGRKVRGYLISAGFEQVAATATFQTVTPPAGITGSPGMESILRDEWGPRFVELGWASKAEIDGWIARSAVHTTSEGEFWAYAWIEALASKLV